MTQHNATQRKVSVMEPRIVVPDDNDAEVVASALTAYLHSTFARVQMTGDLAGALDFGKRAIDLLECVVDAAHAEAAKREFGTFPSDDTIADRLDRMRREMGE